MRHRMIEKAGKSKAGGQLRSPTEARLPATSIPNTVTKEHMPSVAAITAMVAIGM